jgi:hypothetical protein
MAQANFTPISLYFSTTVAAIPTAGNLVNGELAINITDGKLYFKNNSGVVTLLASAAGSSGDVVGPASSTDNALARFDSTTGKLIQNSVGILSDAGVLTGLTGLTSSGAITLSSLTSGRVTYAGTAGLLQDSANLTFNGTDLTVSGAVNAGSINATTLDLTNLEVTNIKAKDGTAGMQIADSTGVVSFTANPVLSGGTANGVAYLNGSKVLTTGSALTFDGTNNLALTGTGNATLITSTSSTTNGAYAGFKGSGDATIQIGQFSASNAGTTFGLSNANLAFIYTTSYASTHPSALLIGSASTTPLVFSTSSTERMRIDVSGNVGIGTSSPASQLTVGDATANPAATVSFFKGTASEYRLKLTSSGFNTDGAWLGLGFGYSDNYMKAAIIAEAKDANARANFHFALNDAASSANAGLSDSKMVLTYSGNLGLGVTPSAWSAGKGVEVGFAGNAVYSYSQTDFEILSNAYYNSGYKFGGTGQAMMYAMGTAGSGIHSWHTSTASGDAGDPITFTQAMTLDANGNLMVGATSSSAIANKNIDVNGTGDSALVLRVGGTTTAYLYSIASQAILGTVGALPITFHPNGTERMRLDSAGNLGLGVAPSASWLGKAFEINGVGNAIWSPNAINDIRVVSNTKYNAGVQYAADGYANGYYCGGTNGTHAWQNAPSGTAGDPIAFTQAMTLTAAGDLGVGTTSPGARVDVRGSATDFAGLNVINSESSSGVQTTASIRLGITNSIGVRNTRITAIENNTDSNSVNLAFFTNEANALNSEVERARITAAGDLLVGTTDTNETSGTGGRFGADGYVRSTRAGSTGAASTLDVYSTGASAFRFYVDMAGTVFATNTTISAISDQRLKENVQDLDAGLDKIMALQPRKFDWKEGKGKNIKGDRGWIAQEFEQVFPDMIDTWKDEAPEGEEPYKSVRADLIPVLVKAMQEQQAIITALTARVAALESI